MKIAELEVLIKGNNAQLKQSLAEGKRSVDSFSDDSSRSVKRAERNIGQSIEAIGAKARATGAVLTATLTAPLIALGKQAVDSAIRMANLERGMTSVSGSAQKAAIEIAKLKRIAEQPGLGFEEAVKGSIRLQAAGLSAKDAAEALSGFGNALATVGGTKAELDGVVTALTQIQSKGKVSAEEINQLAERLPQIRQIMISAFGTANTEILQKAEITSQDFIKIVIAEVNKLPKAAKGPGEDFEKAWEGALDVLRELGQTILPTITKFLREHVIPATEKLVQWMQSLTKEGKENILKIGLLGIALGPGLGLAGMMAGATANGIKLIKALQGVKVAAEAAALAQGVAGGGAGAGALGAGAIGAGGLAAAGVVGGGLIIGKAAHTLVTAGDEYKVEYQRMADKYFEEMDRKNKNGWSLTMKSNADINLIKTRAEIQKIEKEAAAIKKAAQDKVRAIMADGGSESKGGGKKSGSLRDLGDIDSGYQQLSLGIGDDLASEGRLPGLKDIAGMSFNGLSAKEINTYMNEYATSLERVGEALREMAVEKARLADPVGANNAEVMGLSYLDYKRTKDTPEGKQLLKQKLAELAKISNTASDEVGKGMEVTLAAMTDSEIKAKAFMERWSFIWRSVQEAAQASREAVEAAAKNEGDTLRTQAWMADLEKQREAVEAHASRIREIAEDVAYGVTDTLMNAFMNLGNGVQGVFDSLLSGLQSMLADMGRQFIQSQISRFLTSLVGRLISGGGGGGILSDGAASGGVTGVPGLATGGPVLSDKTYMVGEHGPELFIPNSGGRIVSPSGVQGGGTTVHNWNIQTPDVEGFKQSMGQIQAKLGIAVNRAARRNGQ